MVDYYEILNVSENAEIEVIRASYKALAKKYHPDNTTFSPDEAEEKMKLLNEAYQTLSNERLRNIYTKELNLEKNHRTVFSEKSSVRYEENTNKPQPEEKEDILSEQELVDSSDIISSIIATLIWGFIIISIICSICYFAPEAIKGTFYSLQREFKSFIDSFKL